MDWAAQLVVKVFMPEVLVLTTEPLASRPVISNPKAPFTSPSRVPYT